jgi:hypothetical protein
MTYINATISPFCQKLQPVGRILELEDWYVWCVSPVEDDAGRTHVFFSRWPARFGMGGWIGRCEIAHAVAPTPEGPFEVVGTALAPRGPGYWDGTTCHNPHIQRIGGRYYLFYMGNSDGTTATKRVGLAIADWPYGPWERSDAPLLEPGVGEDTWDNHCTTNPAYVRDPVTGLHRLYYKSWNTAEYVNSTHPTIRGNRKYGLATAEEPGGPYHKYAGNPVLDYSARGGNAQLEDAFAWHEDGTYRLLARDMGFYSHDVGLYLESADGVQWSEPAIGFLPLRDYAPEEPAEAPAPHLKRYGRLERPQLLLREGRPAYLFLGAQGGRYQTATGFVLRLQS